MAVDVKVEEGGEQVVAAPSSSDDDDGSDSNGEDSKGDFDQGSDDDDDDETLDAAGREARATALSNLVAPVQLSDEPPGEDEPVS